MFPLNKASAFCGGGRLREHLSFWTGQSPGGREGRAIAIEHFAKRSPSTSRPHLPGWSKTGLSGEIGPDIVGRSIPWRRYPKAHPLLELPCNRADACCFPGNRARFAPLLAASPAAFLTSRPIP